MEVFVSRKFLKSFNKRFRHDLKTKAKLDERIDLLKNQPSSPLLKDHPLKGDRADYRSFSITGDIRVIYYIKGKIAYLFDIGTHSQIY